MKNISVGSVQKFWFGEDRESGSFRFEKGEGFEYLEGVTVLNVNPTDETELELEFSDGTRVWAQEINTY